MRMLLSPLQKWRKFHRFPNKILLQSLVLIIVAIQIYVLVTDFTLFTRANRQTFRRFLLDEDVREGGRFYSIEEFLSHFESVVHRYYHLDDNSIAKYYYLYENGRVSPVHVEWELNDFNVSLTHTKTEHYTLTQTDPLGPFKGLDVIQMKDILFKTRRISQNMAVVNGGGQTDDNVIPFTWNITIEYSHIGGEIVVDLFTHRHIITDDFFSRTAWLSVLSLFFSALSFALSLKAVFSSCFVYKRTKARFVRIPAHRLEFRFVEFGLEPMTEWSDVPFDVKFEFFSGWHLVSLLGDGLVIAACVQGLYSAFGMPTSDQGRFLLGIGALITFTNMTKYLEYNQKFYILIMTLRFSITRIIRFLLGSLPIFLGYIFCGICAFSPYADYFLDISSTAITLFSLINGDDMHNTFDLLLAEYPYPWFAQAYLYTFILLFIASVFNVFIFIIEDAYHLAKAMAKKMDIPDGDDADINYELDWDQLKKFSRELNLEKLFEIIEAEDPELPQFNSMATVEDSFLSISDNPKTTKHKIKKLLKNHRRDSLLEFEELWMKSETKLIKKITLYLDENNDKDY